NPLLVKYFKLCLQRSAAVISLPDAISNEDESDRYASLIEVEGLFTLSYVLPGLLDDKGVTGFTYLGLSYYLTGQNEKALMFLQRAIGNSTKDLSRNLRVPYIYFVLPILLCSSSDSQAPEFFKKDDTLCELFEKRHLHILSIDPLVLGLYLKYRITGDLIHLEKYHELRHYYIPFKETSKDLVGHSLFESYVYIGRKYNLFKEDLEYLQLEEPMCVHTCFHRRKEGPFPPRSFLIPEEKINSKQQQSVDEESNEQ
ncbi:MAG: hypothetical protein AAFY76_24755, partial [Cyanobacteria bacterium J06649_11]